MRRRAVTMLSTLVLLLSATAGAHAAWWQRVSAALDFTPHGTQPGLSYQLLGSNGCQSCHSGTGGSDATFFPYDTWAGSMMANATRDPVFWAALDVANHDQPGAGDYCLRCHTPQGWYGGHVVKNSAIEGSNGCQLAGNYAQDDGDYSGETCHFCHRLMAQGPQGQPAYTENAAAWLDDGDCNGGGAPCRRGPYPYSGGAVGPPPHPWAYSTYHTQSAQCGLCHNVSTADTNAGPLKTLIDAAGHDTGVPFPIERTFREWQRSDFADLIFRDGLGDARYTPALARGEQCQECHMPSSTDPTALACNLVSPPGARTGNLPVHTLVGGNAWVPSILSGEYGNALGRTAAFAQTIAAAQQMLQSAAQVAVTPGTYVAPTAGAAGSLALSVRVTNLSGHKLPTGYSEGRRMWLDVQVRNAGNALIAESGAYDANTGVLASGAQARVYEVLQGIWNGSACAVTDSGGNAQFHFVLNDCVAKDNRIPPLGFSGGSDIETQPVGADYGSGARLRNYDDAPYTFALPAGTALPVSVTATLYYQTASKPYIDFLRSEAVANSFAAENTLCSGGPGRPFAVGPQSRSRAEYLYELWNNAPTDAQPGYGKSPPSVAGNVATVLVGP